MDLKNSNLPTIAVVIASLTIAVLLTIFTWNINFWPTDTRVYYFDAAIQLTDGTLKHVSEMHSLIDQERVKWLHGKEMFILSASFMQRIFSDTETLRPFIFVCIWATAISGVLIYFIARGYWGVLAASICFFSFMTCMWPYVYIMFVKHQPLGLMYFLLSVFCIQHSNVTKRGICFLFFSGFFIAIALFASSISALYLPYFAAAFLWHQFMVCRHCPTKQKQIKRFVLSSCVSLMGFVLIFVYFNYPHVIKNITSYFDYVSISAKYNHFVYNLRILQQWLPPGEIPRGGWLWIIKYFNLIMPILFPVFLVCTVYVLIRVLRTKGTSLKVILSTFGMILLAWSSPILAEIRQIAQYGANYYCSLVGVIMLIGYSIYLVGVDISAGRINRFVRNLIVLFIFTVSVFHVTINAYVFLDDIYPTRMVTTYVSQKFKELGNTKIYTYRKHPHKSHFTSTLSPETLINTKFVGIDYLSQIKDGYILIPPITGDSIYIAATSFYTDFFDDVFLNELIRKGNIDDYTVASYKTLASSRIWPHEEEILTYRYLILNHLNEDIIEKGKVRILDAKKYYENLPYNIPSNDYRFLLESGVRNIGTKTKVYIYAGYRGVIDRIVKLKSIIMRMYKVGNPKDKLRAYAFRIDDVQNFWVPFNENYDTEFVEGEKLVTDSKGGLVSFKFREPLILNPGKYFFVIYRTGEPDDKNYYRIYSNYLGNEFDHNFNPKLLPK